MSHYTIHAIPLEHLHALWRELIDLPFPSGIAGVEVDGTDLHTLDHDIGIIIDRFLKSRGRLNQADAAELVALRRQLEEIIPQLDGFPQFYFEQLDRLTQHVLDELAEHMLHSGYHK